MAEIKWIKSTLENKVLVKEEGSERGSEGGWMVRGGRAEMEREAGVERGEESEPEWTIYSLWQTENNCYTASHNPLQP